MLPSLICSTLLAVTLAAEESPPIETIGLYGSLDVRDQYPFWKACGINLVQFCDTGCLIHPRTHERYYRQFAQEIRAAQQAGFQVWVLLLANIAQWQGPEDHGPGMGLRYSPRDEPAMAERLEYIARAARALRAADGFTFFAGDPGGVPAALGPATVRDWIAMARRVGDVIRSEAPEAAYNVNPWAVIQWEDEGMDVFGSEFWLKERAGHRAAIEEEDFVGPDTGIELPAHNLYRSLTLRILRAAGIAPQPCPTSEEVASMRARGARRLWSWPYFLIDEVDDGYLGAVWRTFGQTQAETRYLHRIIGRLRRVGLNGIIGNHAASDACRAEALNIYAFGRFCRDPEATPEQVIDEFAAFVADGAIRPVLAQVLRFIENHSSWHASLPPEDRLPDLECELESAEEAIEQLRAVTPCAEPAFPLPEPPARYLNRLMRRLEVIRDTDAAALEARAGALIAAHQ